MEYPNNRSSSLREGVDLSPEAREAAAVDAQVDALRAYFSKRPDARCLVVIDPSKRELTLEEGQASALAGLERAYVEIDHDAFPEAHRAYLIELDLSSREGVSALTESVQLAFEDRRPESMAGGLGQRIGGWLVTLSTMTDVAAHWSSHALQYNDEGRPCVLRFYDARALSLIWPVLSEPQQQALLGPIEAWHALDAGSEPCVYARKSGSRASLSLTREQWQSIQRHGPVNRALAQFAANFGRQPQPAEVQAAVASAARAERHGLSDPDDQAAFIEHTLMWHPQFDLHPTVLQLLGARAPDEFYTATIGELTDEQIGEIRDGAWYERLNGAAPR